MVANLIEQSKQESNPIGFSAKSGRKFEAQILRLQANPSHHLQEDSLQLSTVCLVSALSAEVPLVVHHFYHFFMEQDIAETSWEL